ncbi:MAG: hypothetical protein IAE79_19355 [Anaerolinea sp.]|nr:hypothetical protein [Anaerolinea sp.]
MKRTYQLTGIVLLIVALLVSSIIALAQQDAEPATPAVPDAALGSSFTYQGYLTDSSGNPVNTDVALCDFRFRLYDALVSGTQVGADNEVIGADVENGFFTVRVNANNEFGSQAFNGNERYLAVAVKCGSETTYTSLGMSQRLSAVPYALTARSVHSADDIKLYISPHSLVQRGSESCVSLTPQDNGSMKLTFAAGCSPYISAPVSTFGTMFGSALYVKSLRVCYKDLDNNFIETTAVIKNNGAESATFYMIDNTDRGEGVHTCYTVNASVPRKAIDNSSWVQFNMTNMNPMGSGYNFYIYTIELTLSQLAS